MGEEQALDCRHLGAQEVWRDNWRGQAADKMMADAPFDGKEPYCAYADNHPERFVDMPQWMQREVLAAPGWRPKHCSDCRNYSPETTKARRHPEG